MEIDDGYWGNVFSLNITAVSEPELGKRGVKNNGNCN